MDDVRTRLQRFLEPYTERRPAYRWTRFAFLRGLGFVYTVAFLILVNQVQPLLGSDGLLPASLLIDYASATFWHAPSIFWFSASDVMLTAFAWTGLALSVALLGGLANAPMLAALWFINLSFVHVGQDFWGFGWEIMLLEVGFLAIFMVPALDPRPLRRDSPTPVAVVWLLRWVLFRVMFGAGLIKLRGDPCWSDLTCLQYHYETQPNPHPGSWFFHHLPEWVNSFGVAFNHVVELVVPFFYFAPRKARYVAGGLTIFFQLTLIASGNLSFLNWLTIVLALACFDDALLGRDDDEREGRDRWFGAGSVRRLATGALVAVVAALSVAPTVNMLSPTQVMNASFDRLHLVNTYGAFGSVGKERYEIVIEGTDDTDPAFADWKEYDFPCKPGPVDEAPCLITPYHYRVDWQIWFAAMSKPDRHLWLVNLLYKLVAGTADTNAYFEHDPFDGDPPRWVRASLYRYEFTDDLDDGWWQRERVRTWFGPITKAHLPTLRDELTAAGLIRP